MIIVMDGAATEGQIADVVERLSAGDARIQRLDAERVTLAVSGGNGAAAAAADAVGAMAGVSAVLTDSGSKPGVAVPAGAGAAGAETAGAGTAAEAGAAAEPSRGFDVGGHLVGGGNLFYMAGPCSVEDPETMDRIARVVAEAGAMALRAGAYKPRSSPYSFQGMGEEGLAVARKASDDHGLLLVSEVMDATQIPMAARYVDVLQVGARNMFNISLLRELGRARRPVLLKRSFSATIDEWLSAAEYIVSAGNPRVILCERGIRTFETATRNTLDLNAVPVVRARSRLPIVVDPSHGTGKRAYVRAMARAGVAAGADGLMLEVHIEPDRAVSDAAQTIDPATLRQILTDSEAIRAALPAM